MESLELWERLRKGLLSIRTDEGPVLIGRHARVIYASALGLAVLFFTVLLNQAAPEVVYGGF